MKKGYSFLCRNEAELNLALNIITENIPCWIQTQNEEDNILVAVSCETYNFNFVRRQLQPFIIGD